MATGGIWQYMHAEIANKPPKPLACLCASGLAPN
jgi:hypothetical protein